MTQERLQELAEKAKLGNLTQEEELELLQELNKGAASLRELIQMIKQNK
jgi:uncharacterized protein YnzC (UPF0291/DUF896 family)